MSWHDSARTLEPIEESALRDELRDLLGAGPRNYFESEPSPELNLLADDLRREAKRRNHTARKQHSWMLLAAALPFALALGAVSVWGLGQKHKAEGYAMAVRQKEVEIQRLAQAVRPQPAANAPVRTLVLNAQVASRSGSPNLKRKAKELIIPVERSPEPLSNDTQRVKGH
jgi:hypothetical protein